MRRSGIVRSRWLDITEDFFSSKQPSRGIGVVLSWSILNNTWAAVVYLDMGGLNGKCLLAGILGPSRLPFL